MSQMRLQFLGTGEATDESYYNTAFVLSTPEVNILFDCGYAIPARLWALSRDGDFVDIIYISHTHADHAFGLPAVLLSMVGMQRQKPLTIIHPKGFQQDLLNICHLGYEGLLERKKFEIQTVAAEVGETLSLAGFDWRFAETVHPRKNLAVRLDNRHSGQSLAYSGDGDLTETASEFYQGVQCLIHDAFSFESHPGVHPNTSQVVALAHQVGVSQLYLVHIKKTERDDPRLLDLLKNPSKNLQILVPTPGTQFDL